MALSNNSKTVIMRYIFIALILFIALIWNLPIILIYCLISLWHWDWKYVSNYGDRLISGILDEII